MMRVFAIVAAAAAAIFLGASHGAAQGWFAGLFGGGDGDKFAQCRATSVSGGAGQIGGPFELLNAEGEIVTEEDVITRPSLVYFGYTFCPDVCPLDVARNAEAVDLLQAEGHDVQPVFISIDPGRDTPEVVGDFAANMHEDMIGLTGTPEQVRAASKAYRTYYQAQEGDPDYYLVDHSTFTYLVLPDEGFVEFYRREIPPADMAESVGCFVDAM